MNVEREGGRGANQLRPMDCSRNVLSRAHGSASCSHGETKVIAAVFGPKSGTKKNENPEKACIEIIWKPKTGQIGKPEKEFEMILKRTLQNICLLTIHPNTTTSIIVQVAHDDGSVSFPGWFVLAKLLDFSLPCDLEMHRSQGKGVTLIVMVTKKTLDFLNQDFLKLLPCAIHATCAALVDAGFPLKSLAVAICCCLTENGHIILDPSKLEEQKMKAFVCLVFPSSVNSVLPEGSTDASAKSTEQGIITSLTRGVMTVDDYFHSVEQGRAAVTPLSNILRKKMQSQFASNLSKAS